MAARQSTNGIFDGGRSVIHGSLRGHCIRSAGVTLLPVEANCPPRVDRCCAASGEREIEREREINEKREKEEGRREMGGGGRGGLIIARDIEQSGLV